MYCPGCGNPTKEGLAYCNTCGKRLISPESGDTPGKMLNGILETLFWTVILSLGGLVGLVAVMLNRAMDPMLVALVAAIYLLAVSAIGFMLARQIPKLIDARLRGLAPPEPANPPQYLRPVTTAQLPEHHEPVAAVTEDTTRTLNNVPRA